MADRTVPADIARMTSSQRQTYEALLSEVDDLEVGFLREQALGLPEDGDTLVFEGNSADGPAVGYINADGSVEWICGG